eukprot:4435068-Pyramimonas_sp.AAC.1
MSDAFATTCAVLRRLSHRTPLAPAKDLFRLSAWRSSNAASMTARRAHVSASAVHSTWGANCL